MRLISGPALIAFLALVPLFQRAGAGAADQELAGVDRAAQARQERLEPSQQVGAAWTQDAYRQFDFWIGEWDVILRTLRGDNSWEDSRAARAKIYRILDGRAILELWDEQSNDNSIRGYSLRFFDPAREEWRLFLNWPGNNRSGTSTLNGSFRHGRGEFYSTQTGADGVATISRYTFSDISPDRLRWDDGFSVDGGRTWRANWIMEFSHTAERAAWPGVGEAAHTFHTGERCDLAEFREFARLEGLHRGEIRLFDSSGTERTSVAQLAGYRVLDGCAIMTFLEYVSGGRVHRSFSIKTFNTYIDQFEELHLDNQPDSQVRILYGGREGDAFRLSTRSGVHPPVRHAWKFPGAGRAVQSVERGAGGAAWRPLETLELTRVDLSTE
jgi:hypothetical protein